MNHRTPFVCVGLALLLLLAPAGCTGTTASGTAYTMGIDRELRAHMAADIESVHTASRVILEADLLYEIVEDALDTFEGIVRARTARNRYVRVESFFRSDHVTEVQVYESPYGDDRAELDFLNRLEARLGLR